jgi:hypothetical protein
MWKLIRCIVVVLALAGFVGQTTARAMPMATAMTMDSAPVATPVSATIRNCADMPGMADMAKAPAALSPLKGPCKGATPDCIGKMGCATVAIGLPASAGAPADVAYERVSFAYGDILREGVLPDPLFYPPRRLA